MATRKPDPVKYSSPDGGKTKYIENQRVADDLKKLKKPVNAQAGKASGDRSKRMAKNKEYVARKRGSTPTKRTTTAGNTTQPVSRPQNVQGPLMQNGGYGNAPASPPPAQTFAQKQLPYSPMPGGQRPPSPTYPTQMRPPMNPNWQPSPSYPQRPSVFSQPGVQQAAQGMQGMPPTGQPYIDQFMQQQGQMPQQFNPWGRRW